jgi:hypothetical protein
MDDRVTNSDLHHPGKPEAKRRRWRGRLALGTLVLVIIVGYSLMIWALDYWKTGSGPN